DDTLLLPSHTTGHAGPHPAIQKVEVHEGRKGGTPSVSKECVGKAVVTARWAAIAHHRRQCAAAPAASHGNASRAQQTKQGYGAAHAVIASRPGVVPTRTDRPGGTTAPSTLSAR